MAVVKATPLPGHGGLDTLWLAVTAAHRFIIRARAAPEPGAAEMLDAVLGSLRFEAAADSVSRD